MAGGTSGQSQTETAMIKAIREAGLVPVQRNTFYESIKVWDAPTSPDPGPPSERSPVLEANLATA